MAATTIDIQTYAYLIFREKRLPLKAGAVIPAGVMVCTDATGFAVNGSDTAALKMQGRSGHRADATAGDTEIVVEEGVFLWKNDGTIVQADISTLATILDNQTVSKAATTTADINAGYIEEVRSDGLVAIAIIGGRPPGS